MTNYWTYLLANNHRQRFKQNQVTATSLEHQHFFQFAYETNITMLPFRILATLFRLVYESDISMSTNCQHFSYCKTTGFTEVFCKHLSSDAWIFCCSAG